jgi:hypothetical protein
VSLRINQKGQRFKSIGLTADDVLVLVSFLFTVEDESVQLFFRFYYIRAILSDPVLTSSPTCPTSVNFTSCFRILLATDNHIGYNEKDPIRGQDSINTFREILELAREHEVSLSISVSVIRGGISMYEYSTFIHFLFWGE